jgi:hypothetical protein
VRPVYSVNATICQQMSGFVILLII